MAQTMRAWQCATPGPLEKTLKLVPDAPRPSQPLQSGQVLVKVARAALNPADYKILSLGVASRAITKLPKTLGMDLSGHIIETGPDVDAATAKAGDLVMGRLVFTGGEGSLAEYAVLDRNSYVTLPASFDADQAAGAPTAGLTAYLTIQPNVKPGDKLFLNGGSGGVGLAGIQVGKALGCHVTVTCSTAKTELCRKHGADDIIDYKTSDVVAELQKRGPVFAHAVDNVGNSFASLYGIAHQFLVPSGKIVLVGSSFTAANLASVTKVMYLPAFLGGARRKVVPFNAPNNREALDQIAKWLVDGQLHTVIDSVYGFNEVPEAFAHLKKGSSGGKVIVRVEE